MGEEPLTADQWKERALRAEKMCEGVLKPKMLALISEVKEERKVNEEEIAELQVRCVFLIYVLR